MYYAIKNLMLTTPHMVPKPNHRVDKIKSSLNEYNILEKLSCSLHGV